MRFSKQKMIERLTREGRSNMIDDSVLSIMDNLDGQEVTTSSWQRQVYGEPFMACRGKDGGYYNVNEEDCE